MNDINNLRFAQDTRTGTFMTVTQVNYVLCMTNIRDSLMVQFHLTNIYTCGIFEKSLLLAHQHLLGIAQWYKNWQKEGEIVEGSISLSWITSSQCCSLHWSHLGGRNFQYLPRVDSR